MSSDPNKQGQYPPPQWESQPQRGAYPAPSQALNYRVRHPASSSTYLPRRIPLTSRSASSPKLRKFTINTRRDGHSTPTSACATPSTSRDVSSSRNVFSLPARSKRCPAPAHGIPESAGTEAEDGHRLSILQTAQGTSKKYQCGRTTC